MVSSNNKTITRTMTRGVVAALLVTQLTACGTILYPDRRGQESGRIDVGVAVLDALGLLFFFVPGVVAFGVDFATGAIYLPGGKVASLTPDELNKIKEGQDKVDVGALQTILAQRGDIDLPKAASKDPLSVVAMSSKQALLNAINSPSQAVAMASHSATSVAYQ